MCNQLRDKQSKFGIQPGLFISMEFLTIKSEPLIQDTIMFT